MEDFTQRVLQSAGLTEQDLASCASVNLPQAAQPFLDLSPPEVVALVKAGDLKKLAKSKTVWLSGWETHLPLKRLLAALRAVLNAQPDPPRAGRLYRSALKQLRQRGRISHGRLLFSCKPDDDEVPVSSAQKAALRLRGKVKTGAGSVRDVENLRRELSGETDDS